MQLICSVIGIQIWEQWSWSSPWLQRDTDYKCKVKMVHIRSPCCVCVCDSIAWLLNLMCCAKTWLWVKATEFGWVDGGRLLLIEWLVMEEAIMGKKKILTPGFRRQTLGWCREGIPSLGSQKVGEKMASTILKWPGARKRAGPMSQGNLPSLSIKFQISKTSV